MTRWCPSCGGVLGQDCFNPHECAWITQDMQRRAQEQAFEQGLAEHERRLQEQAEAEITARHENELRVLGYCPHGIDLDRDFCPQGCRV